ncbi:MAG: EAL domain-containing protein [Croceibacterium sp.]
MSLRAYFSSGRVVAKIAIAVPVLAFVAGVGLASAVATDAPVVIVLSAIAIGFAMVIGCHQLFAVRNIAEQAMVSASRCADLEQQLGRDPLTGLLNRTAFMHVLDAMAADEQDGGMIMLIFFDLNRFKEVNDTLGHSVGDMLLVGVAKRTAQVLQAAPAIARLGGDEFAAIVPWTDENDARELGDAIVKAMAAPFKLDERAVEVSASVGVAIGDPGIQGGAELLRRADLAMYEAKGSGRGSLHVFDDMLSKRRSREKVIRAQLDGPLAAKQFEMHYQPIFDARTGKIAKAEALLRSRSEVMSGISPSLMVAIAEDSGQIADLTEWTLETAIAASKTLDLTVAVNISPAYFRGMNFADRVVDKLLAMNGKPSSLIIEVTEGVLISNLESARESIGQLREVGIKVYLDDFGTGYSSLSYVQNFDLDGLKLDRSFMMQLGKQEKAKQIIRSMIDFSHSLGMSVIMEGVESEWQARFLQLVGCDYLQGFHLGVPSTAEDLKVLLGKIEQQAEPDKAGYSRSDAA